MKSAEFPLSSPFKPDKSLVSMSHILFTVTMLAVGGAILIGGYFSGSVEILASCAEILILIAGWYIFWVGRYFQTIFF